MSFVRNFEDNQSPADAGGVPSSTEFTQSSRGKPVSPMQRVADSFVRNFSDNQSPADGDSPNASIAAVPGTLAGASDPTAGDKVAGWNPNRGFEMTGEKSRNFDRRVDAGIAKSYAATHRGVEKTIDKITSSSKTDVREDLGLQ